MLTITKAPQNLYFLQQWERGLQMTFKQTQKDRILLFALSGKQISRRRIKLLTRWYQTPSLQYRMFPQTLNVCWGCHPISHFWECLKLNNFWDMVEYTVKELTGVSPERKPAAYLLHDTPLSNKNYKN